jgi:hypothetical protein
MAAACAQTEVRPVQEVKRAVYEKKPLEIQSKKEEGWAALGWTRTLSFLSDTLQLRLPSPSDTDLSHLPTAFASSHLDVVVIVIVNQIVMG